MNFYLDESGDLEWSLDKPYTNGGSSKFLVIACVAASDELDPHIGRTVRQLYNRFTWKTCREKKWTEMGSKARLAFARSAAALLAKKPGIQYRVIIVKKACVLSHLRADGNLLYNYMIKKLLIKEMARHPSVRLVPDPRSIKLQSGNSLPEYLKLQLLFEEHATTRFSYQPIDSSHSLHLQFADMLAGVVSSRYEFGEQTAFDVLKPHLTDLIELHF